MTSPLSAEKELNQQQPFLHAQSLLEACELALARGRPTRGASTRWRWLLNLWLPMEMVAAAARPGLLAFASWCGLLIGGAMIAYGMIRPLAWFRPSDIDSWYLACAYLVTFCFVLGRPSVTAFPGWTTSDITAAGLRFTQLTEMNERNLSEVRFFIGLAETASRRRIVALWWIVGSIWALSAWLAQKGLETPNGNMLASALIPFLFCMFFAGLIAAYTRAVNHVYGLSHTLLMARETELLQLLKTKEMRLKRRRSIRPSDR